MGCLSKRSESWRWHPYWKVHRFQKPTQPNPNYRSEKLKLNLWKKLPKFTLLCFSLCSVFFATIITGWVHLIMACGELFWVDINSQAADWFCDAFVGRVLLTFPVGMSSSWVPSFWKVSHQAGSILLHVQLCVKFQEFITRASYLHPHCTKVMGVLCTFSDNLAGTELHEHRGPIPWSVEGNHDLVSGLCSSE